MASHLKQTKQRVQRETTSTEFVEWQAYVAYKRRQEFQDHAKWEWYLAKIIRFLWALKQDHPSSLIGAKDFLMEFDLPEQADPSKPAKTKEELKYESMMRTKLAMGGILGLVPEVEMNAQKNSNKSQGAHGTGRVSEK